MTLVCARADWKSLDDILLVFACVSHPEQLIQQLKSRPDIWQAVCQCSESVWGASTAYEATKQRLKRFSKDWVLEVDEKGRRPESKVILSFVLKISPCLEL
jgi:hypothetical protein